MSIFVIIIIFLVKVIFIKRQTYTVCVGYKRQYPLFSSHEFAIMDTCIVYIIVVVCVLIKMVS